VISRARRATVGLASEGGFQALVPPYVSLSPLESVEETGTLPLGIVVVGRGNEILGVLAALMQLGYSCPWAVPCLVLALKHDPFEPLVALVGELRHRLVVVTRPDGSGRKGLIAAILRGARNRAQPAPAALARWVTHRLRDQALENPLTSQFEIGRHHATAPASPSVATYSRLFRRYGPYTARDWRAIARLCWHAQASAADADRRGMRLPLRTLMRYSAKYLQVSHHVISKRVGWEWLLEAALRAGGYVQA
jgi:hypothetical protein